MNRDRPAKPKPVRQQRETKLGFTRRPYDEPLSPGLRRRDTANAIGFLADIETEPNKDER